MASSRDKRQLRREDLSDQDYANMCRLFETLNRISRRIAADLARAAV